ncbi:MAG: NAD(P)/FAD-dependent oxidoreductase [Desulfobacterales bacterium]|jgi:phytoene dehydrogenase-like protein
MKLPDKEVIIVGAGLAGLSCARRLLEENIPFLILEADRRAGGRLKTDKLNGFILNHGFQVLQTAYPEARRVLDYNRLALKPFAPGTIVRIAGRFHRIADPRRRPQDFWSTLTAPIGTLGDRLRMMRLALNVRRGSADRIFKNQDMMALEFFKSQGFSGKIINRLLQPFFAGVCLDPEIRVSSRVFQYVFRIFAEGDVALPSQGMAAIVDQLMEDIPPDRIRPNARVESVHPRGAVLKSGEIVEGCAVVLATEGPETARLVGAPGRQDSRGELCLYFAAKTPPIDEPYLILNGDRTGWVNSLTVPSVVAPTYAPAGQHLISVVVLGHLDADDATAETIVRKELGAWFGSAVDDWRHLKTYRIAHALPEQPPPVPDPTGKANPIKPGIFVCGEYGSVPGIQWAMLSGRHAAEALIKEFGKDK